MNHSSLIAGWPGDASVMVLGRRGDQVVTLVAAGDLGAVRPWASVSKTVVALGVAREVESGGLSYDDPVGPPGSTLAHLLAHASGLGFTEGDPIVPVGTRRVYSNVGIDLAAEYGAGGAVGPWLDERVLAPLAMSSTLLVGAASAGYEGSTNDLAKLATEFLAPTLISTAARDRVGHVFLPDLAGIVPGFGRFTPCPWGLGLEVRGDKAHWMGDWPTSTMGHFGQSGALMALDVDGGLAVVATSTVAFGPWATQLWPTWMNEVRALALTL